eukprot:TRINITY_DN100735_c0_g1_i1.p1 TRINITY_DN100735_c0_g1~~TRINITY_DN100735_c0_g1_i1.p1  ORF type:complete len:185 (-),score=34.79 TRINITY_DN100735_c0_g1_i1:27-581(-)
MARSCRRHGHGLLCCLLATLPFWGGGFLASPQPLASSKGRQPMRILRRGWADPNWNWGSPFGDAHDLAMAIRRQLSSVEVRKAWLKDLTSGKVDVEDLKLALGLRIQHAARQGMDGDGAGWQLMSDMAACKYEGDSGLTLLQQDLEKLASRLPATEMDAEKECDALGLSAARALIGMGFVEGGC